MSAFLKRLRSRAAERIDALAAGTAVPAGQDGAAGDPEGATARERGSMRRRLRELRRAREALLLELGALVFELHRRGRDNSELVDRKAAELEELDVEANALARALGEGTTAVELVATGLAGRCDRCGSLLSTRASYCSECGLELAPRHERDVPPDTPVASAPAGSAEPAQGS
jgi:ribosomal protein L37E